MGAKSTGYYLVKVGRLSGWLLLAMIVVYLITGYAMCDRYEMKRLISVEAAQVIHREFDIVLLYGFVIHVSVAVYFALRRRGWLKRRART
jgi:cytochrome b subunit of formate dehydrogenase